MIPTLRGERARQALSAGWIRGRWEPRMVISPCTRRTGGAALVTSSGKQLRIATETVPKDERRWPRDASPKLRVRSAAGGHGGRHGPGLPSAAARRRARRGQAYGERRRS